MTAEIKTIDLTLTRTIPASPAEVYDAWMDSSNPASVWHGRQKLRIEPKQDGLFYLVHRSNSSGKEFPHFGRFMEVSPGRRLQHTWMSQFTRGLESVVTVSFEQKGEDTLVTLRHTGLPDDEAARGHEGGWTHFLDGFFQDAKQKRA
jgi:uncharacterized protein YndB with AHSA1/START domain